MPHFGDERYSRHKVVQALKPSTTLALLVGEKCGLVPCESSRQTRACEISNGEQVKTAEVWTWENHSCSSETVRHFVVCFTSEGMDSHSCLGALSLWVTLTQKQPWCPNQAIRPLKTTFHSYLNLAVSKETGPWVHLALLVIRLWCPQHKLNRTSFWWDPAEATWGASQGNTTAGKWWVTSLLRAITAFLT